MNFLKKYLLLLLVNMNIGGAEMFTEWWCEYRSDGDVNYCSNMTQLDTSNLTGNMIVYTEDDGGVRNYSNVSVADISGFFQPCEYDGYDGWQAYCWNVLVVPADTDYMWCVYSLNQIYSEPFACATIAASHVCITTHPRTNRLLHQTIPPTVYITGLIFNILIILVLYFKADKSVLNFLLLMLSVWDLLYLGCLVAESVIGHYAHNTQIQISDISYAWLDVKCNLGDSSACDVREEWQSADYNIAIGSLYYFPMYLLHVAALMFQIASVYQTIVIATFRCIAIRRPFQAPQLLTSTTAAVATGGCLLLGVAVHVPTIIAVASEAITAGVYCLLKYKVDVFNVSEYNECLSNITISQNPLYSASTTTFMNLHHIYHIITYSIILFMAMPFLLLLVLNILMLSELYRGAGCGPSHDDENKAVTKVVAAIVTVFLFTYLVMPLYIIDIYYFSGHIMNSIAYQSCGGYFTMSLFITVLPALNSVINLLLYLGLRQTFRDQFISMFPSCKQDVTCRDLRP